MATPNFSDQMNKPPDAAEVMSGRLAAEANQKFIRRTVPVAQELSRRIDAMAAPETTAVGLGRLNAGLQQPFNGANSLREAALSRQTGAGATFAPMSARFQGLSSALGQGRGEFLTKAVGAREKARVSYAKMGEGMQDSVTAGLGSLADTQASASAASLRSKIAEADRQLSTTKDMATLATSALGAGAGAWRQAAVGAEADKVAGKGNGEYGLSDVMGKLGGQLWQK